MAKTADGGTTSPTKKPERPTLHGVYDVLDQYGDFIQAGNYQHKDQILKVVSECKDALKKLCRDLQRAGGCSNPTEDFCEPKPLT